MSSSTAITDSNLALQSEAAGRSLSRGEVVAAGGCFGTAFATLLFEIVAGHTSPPLTTGKGKEIFPPGVESAEVVLGRLG
jgi:hypothetical protein